MTGAPFSDRGVQHTPFPSQSPDSEPGVRWLTRAVHRRALEARDVQEHRNTGLHSLSSSQPLTHTFVVALCANGAAIARPRDCSVGLEAAATISAVAGRVLRRRISAARSGSQLSSGISQTHLQLGRAHSSSAQHSSTKRRWVASARKISCPAAWHGPWRARGGAQDDVSLTCVRCPPDLGQIPRGQSR